MKKWNPNQINFLGSGEIVNSSAEPMTEREEILLLWAEHYHEDLTPRTSKSWLKYLDSCSINALRYASEHWLRNSKFFPRAPAEIQELVDAYNESFRVSTPRIWPNHGQGYGEQDVLLLWKIFEQCYPKGPDHKLCEEEKDSLIDEMIARRS